MFLSKELFLKRPVRISTPTVRVSRQTSEVIHFIDFGDKYLVIIARPFPRASQIRDLLGVCYNLHLALEGVCSKVHVPCFPFPVYQEK